MQLSAGSGPVTIDSGAVCRGLDCTGYTNTLTHTAAITLNIGDGTAALSNIALKLVSGMTYTLGSATSTLTFNSTSATQQTIAFGTKFPATLTFLTAGSWIFSDGYTNTSSILSVSAGTVNVNGKTLSLSTVQTFGGTLTLGAANITVSTTWSTFGTISAASSTITYTGLRFDGGGQTYGTLLLSPVTNSGVGTADTFATLTYTGPVSKTGTLAFSANQTITGTLTINGNSVTNRVLAQSNTAGTARTLTAAVVSVTNADFMDITGAGAGSWNLAAITGLSGDCGGNTAITLTTTAAQTHTSSVGGNWSDVTKWTSRVPLPQDDVTVNVNTTGTLTADMPRLGRDLTFTGFVGTADFSSTANSVFSSITLSSGMTLSGTQTLTLRGRAAKTLTSAGASFSQGITLTAPGGTYTLQDSLITAGAITISTGTFAANNFNVTFDSLSASGTYGLNLGSGTWTVTSITPSATIWVLIGTPTLTISTSTIVIGAASVTRTFNGSGRTYNNLQYDAAASTGELIIIGTNTFANLTLGSGRTLTLPQSATTTITGTLSMTGSTLQSSSSGTAATISKASGTVSAFTMSIKDSTATGGALFHAFDSTSVSGNTGWIFSTTSADLILVPYTDVAINGWTNQAGGTTNLYQSIDEVIVDDADYIQSAAGLGAGYYEGSLENHADPSSSNGHIVHYRYQKNLAGGNIGLIVELYQDTTLIKSFTHSNISSSWLTQDQTLSGAEADSITDYSMLSLRFTPSLLNSNNIPTYVAERASANSNSTVTTVDLVLTSLTIGNYLIVRAAADNSGGGGAARTFVPSNFSGTAMGTHTEYQANEDPGAASAGTTCNISVIKIAATSGTIRLTYSGSVVQACVAEEWSGIDSTAPVSVANTATQDASTTLLASITDLGVARNNVVYGVVAIEGPTSDTYTQDADTTNGTWVSLNTVKLGTSNATADTNQTVYGAYKLVTTTDDPQTYNPTINNARDSAGILLQLQAAPSTLTTQVSWANLELPVPLPKAIYRYLQAVKRAAIY